MLDILLIFVRDSDMLEPGSPFADTIIAGRPIFLNRHGFPVRERPALDAVLRVSDGD